MAVDLDATSFGGLNNNVSSFTDTSLTIGTGINRALVYSLNFGWSTYSQPTGISVTWDLTGANQSLSLIAQANDPTNVTLVQLWGLVAPVSGNKTLSVSWASTVDSVKSGGISLYGVDQTGGSTTFNSVNTNNGTSGDPTIPSIITSTSDAYVGSFVCTDGNGHHFNGFNGNQIFVNNAGLTSAAAGYGINQATANLNVAGEGSGFGWAWAATNIKGTILPHTSSVTSSPEIVGATFTGNDGSGIISVPGIQAGDKLIWLQSSMYQGGNGQMEASGYFEIVASTTDYLQQFNNTDL